MISDRYTNNLKFSNKIINNNDKLGILNQNPIIITKSEAFTFNYTDPERLKYAQLLAKRDIQALKSVDSSKDAIQNEVTKAPRQCKKGVLPLVNSKGSKKSEERVTSVKRVPGPQTPSKLIHSAKERPSILKTTDLPTRSMSPPVRDTDTSWRPQRGVERLEQQMGTCTSRLDQLEKALSSASVPGKDLRVLEDKLRSIIQRPQPPPIIKRDSHTKPLSVPFDHVLGRLDALATQMDTIKARWKTLPYETVLECGDLQRFTRRPMEMEEVVEKIEEDHRVMLGMPRTTVMRLDRDRRRFEDAISYPRLEGVVPARAVDWFSEDIVNETLEEIIKEFDDTSGQLVEAIVHGELTD